MRKLANLQADLSRIDLSAAKPSAVCAGPHPSLARVVPDRSGIVRSALGVHPHHVSARHRRPTHYRPAGSPHSRESNARARSAKTSSLAELQAVAADARSRKLSADAVHSADFIDFPGTGRARASQLLAPAVTRGCWPVTKKEGSDHRDHAVPAPLSSGLPQLLHPSPSLNSSLITYAAKEYPTTAPPSTTALMRQRRLPRILSNFLKLDPRSLAAYRIGVGLILLFNVLLAAVNARAFFSDAGVLPRSVLLSHYTSPSAGWSFHFASGGLTFVYGMLLLQAAAAIALVTGYRTSLASFVSWVLLSSLHARNPLLLHGGDNALRILLFWSTFLPLGAAWSWDQRFGRKPPQSLRIPPIAFAVQLSAIYWFGAWLKSDPAWHSQGTAVYQALSLYQFSTPLGSWVSQHQDLSAALTHTAYWWEVLGPFLLFIPSPRGILRLVAVLAFFLFHFTLAATLRLATFPFVMANAWLIFLPGPFWDWLEAKFPFRERLTNIAGLIATRFLGADAPHSTEPAVPEPLEKAPEAPNYRGRVALRWALEGSCALLITYVLLWNLRSVDFKRWAQIFPRTLNPLAAALRLEQEWTMFAPRPTNIGGWPIIAATLADGTTVDLVRDGASLSWDYPRSHADVFYDEK